MVGDLFERHPPPPEVSDKLPSAQPVALMDEHRRAPTFLDTLSACSSPLPCARHRRPPHRHRPGPGTVTLTVCPIAVGAVISLHAENLL